MKAYMRFACGAAVLVFLALRVHAQAVAPDSSTRPAEASEWRAIPTGTTQPLMGV